MVEIRASQLRFGEEEASALLSTALPGIELCREDIKVLLNRTEGWPAGLYLAALSLREHPDPSRAIRDFGGDARHVVDYLTEEVLERQPPELRRFLTRTSILARLTASLCDAVTDEGSSAELLEQLERSNLFLVPLDNRRGWYRYHHLFADLLKGEFARSEPELASMLHRRASEWHRSRGLVEGAIQHAIAAGDFENAGELICTNWPSFVTAGRVGILRDWLSTLGEERLAANPPLALVAAQVSALSGEREQTERWLAMAERGSYDGPLPDGHASLESAVALLRARYASSGVRAMREAVERAVEAEDGARSPYRGPDRVVLGHSLHLSGELEAAARCFEEAVELNEKWLPIIEVVSLALLSLVASDQGRREDAESLAREALRLADEQGLAENLEVFPTTSLALGRVLADGGRLAEAEIEFERALEVRQRVEGTHPWSLVQLQLALAPVRLACGDRSGARKLLDRVRTILDAYPDSGYLRKLLERQERALGRSSQRPVALGESLTDREAAVLTLLGTDLTQRQIGVELYLSLNTIKTHARAIYRKIGASSRAEAVEQARFSGLI
jgi:LuxR family maltose regulon positive regulatory protein